MVVEPNISPGLIRHAIFQKLPLSTTIITIFDSLVQTKFEYEAFLWYPGY